MSVEHVSRTGKRYYLRTAQRKSGRPAFYFSTNPDPPLAESVPAGYEIYENVGGQVFLRKISKKLVTEEEIEIVRTALKQRAEEWKYQVEIKRNTIVVHEAGQGEDWGVPRINSAILKEHLARFAHYQAVLRFVLVDQIRRRFLPERYCFRGSVDDWIPIGSEGPSGIEVLTKRYVKYLGKESFYELF
jgi:hypothetical protein